MWDRWAGDNHNSVVLARSGAGKSYLVKLDILRNLYQGVAVTVIDPEDEYAALAQHVEGTLIQLGKPGVRINPLALPPDEHRPDGLQRRMNLMHTVVALMLADTLTPPQQAVLDAALPATYQRAGINHDRSTWQRPAPTLPDLAATLEGQHDPAARDLVARLRPWTHGSFADLFSGPTTISADADDHGGDRASGGGRAELTVWSLRHLPDEVRAVATYLVLNSIWHEIDTNIPHDLPDPTDLPDARSPGNSTESSPSGSRWARPRRRLVVVDEAWLLLSDWAGAKFLQQMAKAVRKRAAGLTVVTQDAADLLASDLGLAVVSNSATQILLRQAPQAIDAVQKAFALTGGEARMLLNAPRGEGLLICGTSRVAFRAIGSPDEAHVAQTGIGNP